MNKDILKQAGFTGIDKGIVHSETQIFNQLKYV